MEKVKIICEISTGGSAAIVEIQESQGDQISQKTNPEELQITGTENEIELRIESGSHDYFTIHGKKLVLTKPLDRDDTGLSSIRLIVSCHSNGISVMKYRVLSLFVTNYILFARSTKDCGVVWCGVVWCGVVWCGVVWCGVVWCGVVWCGVRQFPVVVLVVDINDNPPIFSSSSYETYVSELTPVTTTVFRDLRATDKDTGSNSLVEFSTIPGDGGPVCINRINDGYNTFAINLPHQGLVTLTKPLDYEKVKTYYLTLKASDKAIDIENRLSATTTLTIHIQDGDDLDPTFVYRRCTSVDGACVNAEYSASVTSGALTGVLNLNPENIKAVDRDSLNAHILYSFANGTPTFYQDIFSINKETGEIQQQKVIDRNTARRFQIIVKAQEQTGSSRFTTAKLTIDVQSVDRNPPVMVPSSFEGFVDENANVGTAVVSSRGGQTPIKFQVTDADIAPGDAPPKYTYELTSNAFKVDTDGYLVVNQPNLDRDPPNLNTLRFQVSARERNSRNGKGTSAPVTITVTLNDINDNAPQLPSLSGVTVQAGSSIRKLLRVEARDNDDGEHARIRYSIHHVSNNGIDKFQINQDTGELQAIGKLSAGEQYSILIQATDVGGKFSQSILDILVSPGPNTGGPVFTQNVYNVQISEGASVSSAVLTVMARDPENDAVTYSIVDGNMKKHFAIDKTSGTIRVARLLDREVVAAYTLIVQASDESNLYSTVRVNIELTDINDRNPEFLQPFYIFSIEEGLADTVVGNVQARDDDSPSNAEIKYSVPADSGFGIDSVSGIIRTTQALDYEKQKIHYVVVTVKDRPQDPRIATATVTVSVLDVQDEPPVFERRFYEGTVPENERNFEILQVKAKDPDTISSITYVFKMGPVNVFRIDPITGFIYTLIPIDYERQSRFELVIGTAENNAINDPMATCTVFINVLDRNDMPPIFTGIHQPITITDNTRPGSTVTTVVATDGDATSPGNQIKYKISGRGKAPNYFKVDDDTGVITVKEYLRNEPDTQYEIEIKAFDSGEPPLMGSTMVTVYVDHIPVTAADTDLGLSDSKYTVEVKENSPVDTVIKILKVINKPSGNSPVICRIDDGNQNEMFYIIANDDKDCVLRTKKDALDFEKQRKYLLKVVISTPGIQSNSPKLTAFVAINVLDVNDNSPYFVVPSTYSKLTNNRYLAVASTNTPAFTPIVKVTAEDRDYEENGNVRYQILKETDPDNYFMIDEDTGFVSNKRTLESVQQQNLPFKIGVLGKDTPTMPSMSSLSVETQLIVNLVEDKNRMILVVHGTSPDKFSDKQDQLISIIQAHTGLIIGIEKMETKKKIGNNTIQSEPMSTDIWFYAIDPVTLSIVPTSGISLKSSIEARDSRGVLLSKISSNLNVNANEIRNPLVTALVKTNGGGSLSRSSYNLDDDLDAFQAALIALAAIVIVLGLGAIVYLCFQWSRYTQYKDRMKRLYVIPKYEPVLVEPSMKEYETQVLQMSVPQDEDGSISSSVDLNMTQNSSKSLDNVSYITKDHHGLHHYTPNSNDNSVDLDDNSPKGLSSTPAAGVGGGVRASSTATTARASSLDNDSANNMMGYEQGLAINSTQNPLFEDKYSSDEESYSSLERKLDPHGKKGGNASNTYPYNAHSTTEL
ncbi:Cadherin-99C [Nymphon striatum]|nr:Cadherin-99C [Nymphon striatum]